MKVFNVFAAVAIAGTLVAAQEPGQAPSGARPQPPAGSSASQAQQPDQSITGCLVQGSGPTVFLLENAKLATDASMPSSSSSLPNSTDRSSASDRSASASTGTGRTYVVTAASASADLKSQLNHQVTIIGTASPMASSTSPSPASSPSSVPSVPSSSPGASMGQPNASPSQSASGQKMNEQNLPRITAKSVVKVSDTCAAS